MALLNVWEKALLNVIKLTENKTKQNRTKDCYYPGYFFYPPPGYSTLHLTDTALNLFIIYILKPKPLNAVF